MAGSLPVTVVTPHLVFYQGVTYLRTGARYWNSYAVANIGNGSTGTFSVTPPSDEHHLLIAARVESADGLNKVYSNMLLDGVYMVDSNTSMANAKGSTLLGLELYHKTKNDSRLEGTITNNSGGALADITVSMQFEILLPLAKVPSQLQKDLGVVV